MSSSRILSLLLGASLCPACASTLRFEVPIVNRCPRPVQIAISVDPPAGDASALVIPPGGAITRTLRPRLKVWAEVDGHFVLAAWFDSATEAAGQVIEIAASCDAISARPAS